MADSDDLAAGVGAGDQGGRCARGGVVRKEARDDFGVFVVERDGADGDEDLGWGEGEGEGFGGEGQSGDAGEGGGVAGGRGWEGGWDGGHVG